PAGERDLALQHIPGFVFVAMDVARRGIPAGDGLVEQGERTPGLFARRLGDHQGADEPVGPALVASEDVGVAIITHGLLLPPGRLTEDGTSTPRLCSA